MVRLLPLRADRPGASQFGPMIFRIASLVIAASIAFTEAAQPAPKPGTAPKREPIVFFLAKGGPNACGRGCDTWIAAEGRLDPGADQLLEKFLDSNNRRNLPIFFNSYGGLMQASMATGRILRARRMTAGVGRTLPVGCRDTPEPDKKCLSLMRSGRELKATLRFDGAVCASGCVKALIGASHRQVSTKAKLGIHAFGPAPANLQAASATLSRDDPAKENAIRETIVHVMKEYAVSMGIDPGIVDAAQKTPFKNVHWMSRHEMDTFGIIAKPGFETRWVTTGYPRLTVMKALSHPWPGVTTIRIECPLRQNADVTIQREIPADEVGAQSVLKITSEHNSFWQAAGTNVVRDNKRTALVSLATLRKAAKDGLTLDESIALDDGVRTRTTPIATQGLIEELDRLPPDCAAPYVWR